ncbi:surface layer protein NpdA [Acidovorax sp. SUPP2539]|uniref:surface layer protein NpdA n=1 Tax=Acidovorax sp. SUPP2539 TaxID=2920878 RepID=UPI0023DE4158|nr:surface layer protein NpdA [Acidovorax sp. SUPP2539]GKS92448.1 surface layer protein NpdA [Acidovorax sp. SUPP2539]
MKVKTISGAVSALLGTLAMAGAAHAGVIAGTGATPSSTQLGGTDAISFKVAEGQAGHALLVPYFTAQNGQMSVLHLVNTDLDNGKVVKVRFRGANNGDSLLSVHVLLSPGDVWTGAVTAGADGLAQLTTTDRSCTLPHLAQGVAQPFSTGRLDPAWTPEVMAANTREGAIEAIVMADVPQAAIYGPNGASQSALSVAIQQVKEVAPCSESVLNAALMQDTSSEAVAASRGLAAPSGQLSATWYVIDVPGSTTFSGAATAIQAINNTGLPARGNYMLFPPTDTAVSQPERYTADPLLVSAGLATRNKDAQGNTAFPTTAAVVLARYNDLPDLSTPVYLPATADSARATAGDLSRLLAVREFKNQYVLDDSISARTDWVVATPTKRYSVAKDYSQSDPSNQRVYSLVPPTGGGEQYFHSLNTQVRDGVCSRGGSWSFRMGSRDGSLTPESVISDAASQPESCGALSVLSFSDTRSAVSSSVARKTLQGTFSNGWAIFRMPDARGIPLIGTAFTKLSNPSATPGVAANYGLTFPHVVKAP